MWSPTTAFREHARGAVHVHPEQSQPLKTKEQERTKKAPERESAPPVLPSPPQEPLHCPRLRLAQRELPRSAAGPATCSAASPFRRL